MPLSQQGLGGGAASLFRGGAVVADPGQAQFTNGGQYTWTVPVGVSEVSVVLIGGGGGGASSTAASNGVSGGGGGGGALSWRNAISVSGGSTLYITVGSGGNGATQSGTDNGQNGGDTYIRTGSHTGTILARAGGGGKGKYNDATVSNNGGTNYSGTYGGGGSTSGGGDGGRGGRGQDGHAGGGGGGAGGYSGNGGQGNDGSDNSSVNAPSGGGGGGSQSQNTLTTPVIIGGGGTDLVGEGTSGQGTGGDATEAVGGYQGSTGGPSSGQGNTVRTKSHGGGGSGAEDDSGGAAADGGDGAVRIIWGAGRSFPSTNTTNVTTPYDYSFSTEVHYGNGSSGDGGSQNYHYSGDGTMPAINLGSNITNWDMYFECYVSNADQNAGSNDWVVCSDGYNDTNGLLLGFYNNNVTGEMSIAHPNGGYAIYPSYGLPADTWNWVKIEWRGGLVYKVWQKTSAGASWTNRVNWVDTGQPGSSQGQVYSGTNWNFCSIGQGRVNSGDGFQNQFYGKIKNFALNVNENVTNLP